MIRNTRRILPAFLLVLSVGGAATAATSEETEACMSMLASAIGMQLESEGFDMANACNLTVAQLAQIKDLLETDGMGARTRIDLILADAK